LSVSSCSIPGLAAHLAAENLFLRKLLALEHKVKPHRANDSACLIMVILERMVSSRGALVNVQPIPSYAATARDSVSSGVRNPGLLADRKFPRICAALSQRWPRKIHLGRGTYRQRVETEPGDSDLSEHCRQVPLQWPSGAHACSEIASATTSANDIAIELPSTRRLIRPNI
jgi:hypothetical protein